MSTVSKRKRPSATPANDADQARTDDQTKAEEQSLNANLYDHFVEKSRAAYELGKEKGHAAWEKAMDHARHQMAAADGLTGEQGEAFKRFLRRDIEQTARDMRRLGKEAKVSLHPARVGAGALSSLAKALGITGGMLTSLSEKIEHALIYQSGEITMAGTITCSNCGKELHLRKTSEVPVCPHCQGTTFRKGY
jgi:isocitrate dehydrogenase